MKTTKLYLKLGQRIRQLRHIQGISQERLAEEVGVHRTYIGAIERGEKRVSLAIVGDIADSLQIELYQLFQFDGD